MKKETKKKGVKKEREEWTKCLAWNEGKLFFFLFFFFFNLGSWLLTVTVMFWKWWIVNLL